jgi:hypothetical protein
MRAPLFALACAVVLGGGVGAAGCGSCEPDHSTPAPDASAPAARPVATTPPSHTQHSAPPKLACRVIALDGDARIELETATGSATPGDAGGPPLLLQGLVPTEAWVDLAKGTRVVAKDPHTTRETTFRGPGRVRACVDFTEESWLASGRFESTVGAGETPGAEEWVVTPYGVVRYDAAKLAVDVTAHEADVDVEGGLAFGWGGGGTGGGPSAGAGAGARVDAGAGGGGGASDEGWIRMQPGRYKLAARGDAAAAVDTCGDLARTTRGLAAQIMAPDGGADGGVIIRQVTTRRLARAACAVATLRVNALPRADASPLLHALTEDNAAWSGLPK